MEFPATAHVRPLKGWRFRPTDEELVGYYLLNKITGSTPLPNPNIVRDFDVFGKQEPWEIWNSFRNGTDDDDPDPDDLYFFTKPKKTTPKGKRFNRKVGSGTWKGQDSGTEIYANIETGEAIVMGLKKRFHYENKQYKEHDGSWIMFEYCLAGSLENRITSPDNDFVLCQIRKKNENSKKKRKKLMIMNRGDDNDYVMPPLKNQKTNNNGGVDADNGTMLFAVPPLQALPICQEEPPFPILPQDLTLAVEDGHGDHGHNTNVQVDPLPLPLPCPQQQQQQQPQPQPQPPLPQSSLPLPAVDDDSHMPLPPDGDFDDFIIDFGVLDDFNL
ncbi:NAC domain-containing protein 83 [Ziziphus jujuba]|uniref:NAC domain-containing protein 83 n=1 Tax=Ziziphus jujuba TaxID=326968 RepID=A0ABM3IWU1_ZIZJJ|nr:NAC domain-containing protein 83 [Ziziphus jujuba]